jgi:hypothetical protein
MIPSDGKYLVNELINKSQQPTTLIQAATQSAKSDAMNNTNQARSANASSNTSAPVAVANTKTAMLDALVKQLSRQGTVQAEVSSSQYLDSKAQQLLVKTNPTLAAQLQSQSQQTQQSGTSNSSSSAPTAMYLVKLSQMGSTLSNNTVPNNGSNNSSYNATNQANAAINKPTLLTTITPTPFKIGDQLQLQMNSQQQITIKPSVASVRPVIADSLKSALPQQQNLSLLLNTLATISKLPAATQDILLAKGTQTALQQLTQFAYTDKKLSSGNSIKNALTNSGVLTENKLQQQQLISSDLRIALGQLSKALGQSSISASSESQLPKTAFDQLITQLIQQLPQSIITAKPTANNVTLQVTAIMQLLGLKTDANVQTDIKKIKDMAAKKIGQMAQGVQDKIHLNQLRLLGADSQSSDSYVANHAANKSNAFITEIALRWGDQVLPLQLSIAEEKQHKKESNEDSKTQEEKKIRRRWQVFMSFDLPSTSKNNDGTPKIDTLHSQLTIIGDTISATLWSESSSLCHKAKQQFSNLRNTLIANGLQVDELQCINGKPPSQKMSLDYHLVDITT